MNAIFRWLADRTGMEAAVDRCENHKIPGGAGWGNVWPAAIVFTFAVQAVTGLVIWMYYSPGAQSAWESVYYLQYEVTGGCLLRGIHHYAAQVLVGLSLIYVVAMVFRGTYRAPRELVFWTAVLVGLMALAMCLTGDLLAWTQNGYWATQVRVKFLTLLPVVGGDLFKLAAGGPAFGHLTLTRFFALHAGLFAAILAGLVLLHLGVLRRAEAVEAPSAEKVGWYWPNQAVMNAVACLVVMAVIGLLVSKNAFRGGNDGRPPAAYLGVELGAPANPADAYAAARPEWSLLGVYELSNMFPGDAIPGLGVSWKVVPIFIIPGIVLLVVLAMPFTGRVRGGYIFNVAVTVVLLLAVLALSIRVIRHDLANEAHQAALAAGHEQAVRAVELARSPEGIPVGGALALLRSDPKTQGPELFKLHCASCHDHTGGKGIDVLAEESSAPDLGGFASYKWIEGFLDRKQIDGPKYFGNTALKDGTMVGFVKGNLKELVDDIGQEEFQKLIAVLAGEAALDSPRSEDEIDEDTKFLFEDFTCADCHKFYDVGSLGAAPDLTAYGSREWLAGIICDPTDVQFYGDGNDRMPSYAKDPDDPAANLLTVREIEMLADWLRGTWYEPGQAAK